MIVLSLILSLSLSLLFFFFAEQETGWNSSNPSLSHTCTHGCMVFFSSKSSAIALAWATLLHTQSCVYFLRYCVFFWVFFLVPICPSTFSVIYSSCHSLCPAISPHLHTCGPPLFKPRISHALWQTVSCPIPDIPALVSRLISCCWPWLLRPRLMTRCVSVCCVRAHFLFQTVPTTPHKADPFCGLSHKPSWHRLLQKSVAHRRALYLCLIE